MTSVQSALIAVRDKISETCVKYGRHPDEVSLVAVSKTYPLERIDEAVALNQLDFAENKPQAFAQRVSARPELRWHLIGHLQTNKIKLVAPHVALIHSVDSPRLLEALNHAGVLLGRSIPCLLQRHISGEPQKQGLSESELEQILSGLDKMTGVEVRGLMGMAEHTDNIQRLTNQFKLLTDAQAKYQNYIPQPHHLQVLSFGMSDDFEVAIACGSTMVRVGSRIFGKRS